MNPLGVSQNDQYLNMKLDDISLMLKLICTKIELLDRKMDYLLNTNMCDICHKRTHSSNMFECDEQSCNYKMCNNCVNTIYIYNYPKSYCIKHVRH